MNEHCTQIINSKHEFRQKTFFLKSFYSSLNNYMDLIGLILRIPALILFAVGLSGCASISDEKYSEDLSQQWVGKTISEITALQKRPPSRIVSLPDGTVFYVWSQDRSYAIKGNYVSSLCEITAQVDGTGVVISVFSSGCHHFKTGEHRYY